MSKTLVACKGIDVNKIFLKELMLIKQVCQKNVMFVTISILSMNRASLATSVLDTYLYNGCHDIMQKAISFNIVAIVYVKGNAHRINFWYKSKDDAINIMNGSNLIDKMGVL